MQDVTRPSIPTLKAKRLRNVHPRLTHLRPYSNANALKSKPKPVMPILAVAIVEVEEEDMEAALVVDGAVVVVAIEEEEEDGAQEEEEEAEAVVLDSFQITDLARCSRIWAT